MLRSGRKQGSEGSFVGSQADRKTDWGCRRWLRRRSEVPGGESVYVLQMTGSRWGWNRQWSLGEVTKRARRKAVVALVGHICFLMVTSSKHKTFFFWSICTHIGKQTHRGVCRAIKEPLWGQIQCVKAVLQSQRLQPPPTAVPCPALPCLHWRLSVLTCWCWFGQQSMYASAVQFGTEPVASVWNLRSFPFFLVYPPSSRLPSCSCSVRVFRAWGACGPVGRGLIPSARGFCQSLVPFCVMVLTERTPHLTPIELWGWAAGRPARANAAPCSAW